MGRQLSAFEELKRFLNNIYLVKQRAGKVAEFLKEQLERVEGDTERLKKDLEAVKAEKPAEDGAQREAWEILLEAWENLFSEQNGLLISARDDLEVWHQESNRRTAITYCIAFESFLRNFLIEQIELSPQRMASYLRSEADKELRSLAYSERVGFDVEIKKPPQTWEEIDDCVGSVYPTFQDLNGDGSVTVAYRALLNNEPFGRFVKEQGVFASAAEHRRALADVLLLFSIRHKIIHRNGEPDKKYRRALRKHGCYERICEELRARTQDPWPDDILSSAAVESNRDKLDEFSDSLLDYARYITQISGKHS